MWYLLAFTAMAAAFVAYYALFERDGRPMTKTRLTVGLASAAIVAAIWINSPESGQSSDCRATGPYVWDC